MDMADINPSIYSDIASSSMNMMPTPMYNPFMGGMYYNTNLLGGARLQPQLDSDKLQIMNSVAKKDKNVFYKAMAGLSILATLGFLRFGKTKIGNVNGVSKFFKSMGSGIGKGFKALGKGLAYPFVLLAKGGKGAGKGIKKGSSNFVKWIKGLRKPKAPTPAGTPKKSWFSWLKFWQKSPTPPPAPSP